MTLTKDELLRKEVTALFEDRVQQLINVLGVTAEQARHYLYVHILLGESGRIAENIKKDLGA